MQKYFGNRLQPEIWEVVNNSAGVLLIGCEGGFSLINCLPIYFGIKSMNKPVHLCNISLASLKSSTAAVIYRDKGISNSAVCYEISAATEFGVGGTKALEFFPEKYLCQWFSEVLNENIVIYATERTGPENLSKAYEEICNINNLDLIIIVDHGSDSLMAGNEQEIGGYLEDMLTIFAANRSGIKSVLCNVGIGCDRYFGVSDCSSWRAIAELTERQGFLGSLSLNKHSRDFQLFVQANEYVSEKMPRKNVPGLCIIAAVNGKFGNCSFGNVTNFITPIMAQTYFFRLEIVVRRILYREYVEEVNKAADLVTGIEYYRENLKQKIREEIPRTNQF